MPETSSTPQAERSQLGRLLPLLVPLILALAAVAAFVASRASVDDQESRILRERTAEVKLILDNALANIPSALRPLGVAARLGDEPERAFLEEGREMPAAPGDQPDVALVRLQAGAPTVAASLGDAPRKGTQLTGERADAVRRALAKPGLAATRVFGDGGRRHLAFAVGPPVTRPGEAIYQEAPVNPRASGVGQQDAFHEIKAVIYATPQARPDQIIIATTNETLRGDDVGRAQIAVGDQRWLLLTSPREPLVGSFATAVPWIVLGVGLLGALLAGAVTLALLRRRDYALRLVDERTGELERSLVALEETQSRLVLQERLAAIGQVAAAVGHELRNPLGVITNALFLVRARVTDDQRETVGKHIDTAEREVAAAATIVESLLDFAREREPATGSVDLPDLIEEALSVAPPPGDVHIVRRGLEDVPMVAGDRQQLRQVLLNLLTNGYEAMDGEGTLTVEASRENGNVVLRVADTGAGMDDATAARVFEPFFTTKAKGIGLGLPVTKRIVEMHGGTITAESQPGGGTAFLLTVPVMVDGAR
jgi:signal transduction histidine kinase